MIHYQHPRGDPRVPRPCGSSLSLTPKGGACPPPCRGTPASPAPPRGAGWLKGGSPIVTAIPYKPERLLIIVEPIFCRVEVMQLRDRS